VDHQYIVWVLIDQAERPDGVNRLGAWDDLTVNDFGNIYMCGSLRGELLFNGETFNTLGRFEFDRLFAHYTSDGILQDL